MTLLEIALCLHSKTPVYIDDRRLFAHKDLRTKPLRVTGISPKPTPSAFLCCDELDKRVCLGADFLEMRHVD